MSTSGKMKYKDKYFHAVRVAPFCFQLPEIIGDFLSHDVICTVFSNKMKVRNKKGRAVDEGKYIALVASEIWYASVLPQIERLPSFLPETRKFQRLAIGYSEAIQCINGILDLSSLGTLIEFSVQSGFLHDDLMLLNRGERSVQMFMPDWIDPDPR